MGAIFVTFVARHTLFEHRGPFHPREIEHRSFYSGMVFWSIAGKWRVFVVIINNIFSKGEDRKQITLQ